MTRLLDLLHELRIHLARIRFTRYPTKANYYRMANLCQARSAAQVRRMERQRGLA